MPLLADLLSGRRALLVTTPTVAKYYRSRLEQYINGYGLDVSIMVLKCRERSKNLGLVARVCQDAMERRIGRRGLLIGMGGGVCTDIVTMAASWIRRGISHVRIPTTLVGQIDAGIGIKGAVNFRGKKSYLGCFYQPEAVLIDPAFLATVPKRLLKSGIAEMIKIALVKDAELFELSEAHASEFISSGFARPQNEARHALWLAIVRMLDELETNFYENKTYKRLVDFGHTFSPALEAASQFRISHGEAVAIDMALSATLACELGLLPETTLERILASIAFVGLPISSRSLEPALCRAALEEAARHRGGAPNLVLPTAIGEATFLECLEDLQTTTLHKAIRSLSQRSNDGRQGSVLRLFQQETECCPREGQTITIPSPESQQQPT